jgi:hypothetical protein
MVITKSVHVDTKLFIACTHNTFPNTFSPQAQKPNSARISSFFEVSIPRTVTHHLRYDSSVRVIRTSQSTLPDNLQQSKEIDIHAPPPPGGFFLCFLNSFSCSLFVLLPCFFILFVSACSCLLTVQHKHLCSRGIRTRNPSKRSVTGIVVRNIYYSRNVQKS